MQVHLTTHMYACILTHTCDAVLDGLERTPIIAGDDRAAGVHTLHRYDSEVFVGGRVEDGAASVEKHAALVLGERAQEDDRATDIGVVTVRQTCHYLSFAFVCIRIILCCLSTYHLICSHLLAIWSAQSSRMAWVGIEASMLHTQP